MEADGTLDWGSSRQYGTLTWDTNKAIIAGQANSSLEFRTNNSGVAMTIDTSQRVGIGTTSPDAPLDINGNRLKIRTARTIANADDNGEVGEISWDANYLYVCVNTDTWKRVALSTW